MARGRPSPVVRKQTVRATYGESSGLFFQTRDPSERTLARGLNTPGKCYRAPPDYVIPLSLSRSRRLFLQRASHLALGRDLRSPSQSTIDSTSFRFVSFRSIPLEIHFLSFAVFSHVGGADRFDCSPTLVSTKKKEEKKK